MFRRALPLLLATAVVASAAPLAASATAPHPAGAPAPLAAPTASGTGVTIVRDAYGVPQIYADTTYDLFRGYGYAVAQDRLFQMEMSRRSTQGTVSEVLGADYVALDKDTRTGMNPESIRQQLAALPTRERDILEGYAAGMNERLREVRRSESTLLPKEFTDYGFRPADWSAYDVAMVWIGTMANRYSDSTSEIPNYLLMQSLAQAKGDADGRALFDQLVWTEDKLAPTTVPRASSATVGPNHAPRVPLAPLAPGVRDVGVEMMKRDGAGSAPGDYPTASNIWVIGRQKAVGARSILYNGPQFSWFNPSYVYSIGLHGAGYDFSGTTPFAYPAVIFGTNGTVSWGATAGALNLVDMYQERLNPADHDQYWYDGAWRDMTVTPVTIAVKGQPDVVHEVRRTVHGVVTSMDPANHTAYSKKRSWSGHEVASLIAWAKLPKAQNYNQFLWYGSKFKTTINWYYSDSSGNIGYLAPGLLPRRPANQDIRIPAVGDGSMEWEGYLGPSQNPKAYNPKEGFIANWNNQTADGHNSDFGNWSVVDRLQEIRHALTVLPTLDVSQVRHLDRLFAFRDLNSRYVVPLLKRAVQDRPADDPTRRDVERMVAWDDAQRDKDGDGYYDGPEPTIMRAWLPVLFQRVLADDLPAPVYASYTAGIYPSGAEARFSIRPAAAMKLLYNAILGPKAGVPQTVDFLDGEDPQTVLLETFEQTMASLRASQGSDLSAWRTPVATNLFNSRNFLGVPQTTPDRAIVGPQYQNKGTASILTVLGGPQDRLCLSAAPGQSGFIAPDGSTTRHYDDQLAMWTNFWCRDQAFTADGAKASGRTVHVLP